MGQISASSAYKRMLMMMAVAAAEPAINRPPLARDERL
jgi:hypothetical protein